MPYDRVLQENIEYSKLEQEVVALEEFQRLKNIKQNGFSYVLYPDARNNRFDHSVGTMYWATHLFNSVSRRDSSLDDDDLQALRLAALVHDAGHGPFSHAMEILLDRNPELLDVEPWSVFRKEYGNRSPHELVTLNFLDSTLKEILPSKNWTEVGDILRRKSGLSILISGDLDADRLDYLTRDSHYSGLPFGFNVKPVFNQLIQQDLQIKKRDSGYFLLIDSESVPAFEQLMLARYSHYYYIAYRPRILLANLIFVSELEKSLRKKIGNSKKIARTIFYIFSELTDERLLELDFSDVDDEKRKLLEKIGTPSLSRRFEELRRSRLVRESSFIRLAYLGKDTTYELFKRGTKGIKDLEKTVSGAVGGQQVKMYLCRPSALCTRTCVFDRDMQAKYRPSIIYDYSPMVRALEQKMYLDCGVIVSSRKRISRAKMVKAFAEITRGRSDFDWYTYAIPSYIRRAEEFFPKEERKWKLRRTGIYKFLSSFAAKFFREGKIERRIEFETPWYSEEAYEILQELEFLDVLDEDFNLSAGNGFIPCYAYSVGEHADELLSSVSLEPEEKYAIEMHIEEFVRSETP